MHLSNKQTFLNMKPSEIDFIKKEMQKSGFQLEDKVSSSKKIFTNSNFARLNQRKY